MYVEAIVDQLAFCGEAEKLRIVEPFCNCNNHFEVTFVRNNLRDSADLSRFSFHTERFHQESFSGGVRNLPVFCLLPEDSTKQSRKGGNPMYLTLLSDARAFVYGRASLERRGCV